MTSKYILYYNFLILTNSNTLSILDDLVKMSMKHWSRVLYLLITKKKEIF